MSQEIAIGGPNRRAYRNVRVVLSQLRHPCLQIKYI